MADVLILAAGTAAAPAAYEVPNAQVILPKAVHAVFNGSGASGSFVPVLEIVSDAGIAVATCPLGSTIAAGGAAEVSWFPCAALTPETTSGLAVTEVLYLNPTVASQSAATVLATGTTYLLSVQGTYSLWNTALATGVPEATPMFPPASSAGRVSTQVGLDADTTFAIQFGSGVPIGHNPTFQIDLGGGFAHVEPAGGPYTTPQGTHYYTYSVVGQGSAPRFRINDLNPPDNYGELKITIYGSPAGGAVVGLAAADTSIVIGGSASAPTVATASLDVIAADHPTAADWSNNSHKITAVTDPTNPQDAATKNYVDSIAPVGGVTSITSTAGTITVTNPAGPAANVDLPNSGAAAGAYGDATHVARVTVDAQGRVTGATSVAIGGVAGAVLFDSELVGDAANIDTTGTSLAGFTQLLVMIRARSAVAAASDNLGVNFNNDAGLNQFGSILNTSGAATATTRQGAAATAFSFLVPGATAPAGIFGGISMQVPFYSEAGFVKTAHATFGFVAVASSNHQSGTATVTWNQTAAITRLIVSLSSAANLKAGSRLTVYGL